MLDGSQFRDLVSGRSGGAKAAALRFVLRLAEWPYRMTMAARNFRYDIGNLRSHAAPVPVVSVGNLTLGGTGKTPMVEWIARRYRGHGVRVAIVSRGYGAEAGGRNDEAAELEQRLPDVPHLQNPDRLAAALTAVEELGAQLLVLDDAFQHRRIRRDFDIVMLDATEPFGYDHVFPRGMLRESLRALRRADAIVLSRADMVSAEVRREIRRRATRHAAKALWAEAVHAPQALYSASGERTGLDTIREAPVAAFCGIGNPDAFRRTVEACGGRVTAFRPYADHHRYSRDDIENLRRWAAALEVAAVVCTHKDLVKLAVNELGGRPLRAIAIGMEFIEGEEALRGQLDLLVPAAIQSDPQGI